MPSDEEAFEGIVDNFDEPVTIILTQRSEHWLPEIDIAGAESTDDAILATVKALFMLLNDTVDAEYGEIVDEDEDDDN